MQEPTSPWISIRSDEISADIDPQGAQLSILRDGAGRDLLWNGDPAIWSGRSPLLFPIVGALVGGAYRVGGKTYHLSRHGFARSKRFSVEGATPSTATFRLTSDEATLLVYPFRFQLAVHFAIEGSTLTLTSSVRNLGDGELIASIGYHPGFRWPLPYDKTRSSHFILFDTEEPDPIRRIGSDGLLTPQPQSSPVENRRLPLADALFQDDVVIFDKIRSRSVTYGSEDGPRIRVSFPDAPYLGVWTKPGAPFICIEPWHGVTDPAGFKGEFRDKPGVFTLPAGETFATTMAVSLLKG
jgi:galactose mutarotase-like enzyme